jgi:hypothetical protein
VREIADEKGMPAASTIYHWLAKNEGARRHAETGAILTEGFADLYERAKAFQQGVFEEEILAIADDGRNDWVEKFDRDGNPAGTMLDKEAVMRSRLRVDTRKWIMAHRAPKKYGEKLAVETTGADGGPIKVENAPVTLPALDAVLAKLVKLSGGPKVDAEPDAG